MSRVPGALAIRARGRRAAAPARARSGAKAAGSGAKAAAAEGAVGVTVLALIALPLPYLLRFDASHVVTASILGLVLCGVSLYARRAGIVATAVFLAFLGDYRRYAGHFQGYPDSDPLLLVGAVGALFLFACALLDGRLKLSTGVAKLVAALMLLMFLQIFNPLQGGLTVGFAGALFYLIPLCWFWVGRAYGSVELLEYFSFRVVLGIGIAAVALGLYQARFGLLAFEQQWVEQIGYGALYISNEVIRAIGFFNSSAEYQRYLSVTAVTLLAAWLARRSSIVLLLPLVLVALFLAAARGPVVGFVGAAVIMWSMNARAVAAWAPRFALGAAAGVVLSIVALTSLRDVSFGERFDPLVNRQVEGLLDPANERTSTATGHLQMMRDGLISGFTHPAGQGLGATTIAAAKYGVGINNAEVDFANSMIALGLVGGVLYISLIVAVLAKAVRWWRVERQPVALVTVGILAVTFGGWLIGGEYSIAAVVWLFIGAMDKLSAEAKAKRRKVRHAVGVDHA